MKFSVEEDEDVGTGWSVYVYEKNINDQKLKKSFLDIKGDKPIKFKAKKGKKYYVVVKRAQGLSTRTDIMYKLSV